MPETSRGYIVARKDKYAYKLMGRYFQEGEEGQLIKAISFFQRREKKLEGVTSVFWPMKIFLGSAGFGHIRPLDPEEKKALGKEK